MLSSFVGVAVIAAGAYVAANMNQGQGAAMALMGAAVFAEILHRRTGARWAAGLMWSLVAAGGITYFAFSM